MALLQIAEPGMSDAPHEKRLTVGIDLGTTNSLVATVRSGENIVLADASGEKLLPSVVRFTKEGTIVGEKARQFLFEDPENTIASAKRLLGKTVAEIEASYGKSYRLDETSVLPKLKTQFGFKTPIEVSSEILKVLKIRAEETLGGELLGAVITVPAYFDDAQRQATKDAAKLAGLHVLRLLNEPTAAALAYGLDKKAEGLYVVYDLGGGTFDVSLLELKKGIFEVRATGGDASLGGDDYDARLAAHIAKLADFTPEDASALRALRAKAREIKESLTQNETSAWSFDIGEKHLEGVVSRETFAQLTADLTQKTLTIFQSVIDEAGYSLEAIAGIVFVGGSTRMPSVKSAVRDFFGRDPLDFIDPDTVVATGAAYQADLLAGNRAGDDWLLLDVTPLSLGLETMGGLVEKIIPRNTPIPVARAQDFTTFKDGQRALAIHVVQGERDIVEQCRSLARFELRGIPPLVAGSARIRVTFTVDADGLLSVSAREMKSGVEASVKVKPSYGLTDEEIVRMLNQANAHAATDMAERALREKVLEAKRLIVSTQSAMAEDADLLTEAEFKALQDEIKVLEAANVSLQVDAIDEAFKRLSASTETFAAKRMNRAIERALSGKKLEEIL